MMIGLIIGAGVGLILWICLREKRDRDIEAQKQQAVKAGIEAYMRDLNEYTVYYANRMHGVKCYLEGLNATTKDSMTNTTIPFVKLPSCILHDSRLNSTAKLVYCELLLRQGVNSNTEVSQENIALAIGVSVRSVQRAINQLRDMKLIATRRQFSTSNVTEVVSPESLETIYGPAAFEGHASHHLNVPFEGIDTPNETC